MQPQPPLFQSTDRMVSHYNISFRGIEKSSASYDIHKVEADHVAALEELIHSTLLATETCSCSRTYNKVRYYVCRVLYTVRIRTE